MRIAADNSSMRRQNQLSNETPVSHAHQLRLQTLQGSASAEALAHDYEIEPRDRSSRSVDSTAHKSAKSESSMLPIPADSLTIVPWPAASTNFAPRDHVAAADLASDAMTKVIGNLLGNLRELLGMDIALVAEFLDGQRIFRHVDEDHSRPSRLQVGQSVPLEGTYCQRVIDGRLPAMIPDTAALPETQGLASTQRLGIGAYLSTPVVLSNGEVYGTLCCISHQARSALGCRQTDALRSIATLVSAEIEKSRCR